MLALIALQLPVTGIASAFNVVAWAIAFLLGVAGWFVGDMAQGYLYLKQTGVRRR